MRIVKVMVLVVAIALVPLSAGMVMLKQQQNAQDALDRALTSQVSAQHSSLQSIQEQSRKTLAVMSVDPLLNLPFTNPGHLAAARVKMQWPLLFLARRVYFGQMGAAGVISNYGRCPTGIACRYEIVRVVGVQPTKGGGVSGAFSAAARVR